MRPQMTAERPKISRKAAIEAILISGGTLFTALYAPRVLKDLDSLAKTIPPDDNTSPDGRIDTPTQTHTANHSIEIKPTTSPTMESWKIPTIEERKSLFANPDFFMKPQDSSGKIILTPQFADSEWERLKDRTYFFSCDYKGNGCSEAVIASIVKAMSYFKNGKVPDVTAADIVNNLLDKTYQGYHYIWPNNISMQDNPLKWALELYGQETGLFKTVGVTTDWGLSNTHVVPTSEWSSIFKKGRREVLDKGGVLVARVLKYGVPPGSAGHFIIISNFVGDEPLIVDSIGPKKDGERRGDARVVALATYSERVDPGVPNLGGKPGFLWMAGVIPNF